jgi:hypothetical protein
MRLERTWILRMSLLLVVGLLGCAEQAQPARGRPAQNPKKVVEKPKPVGDVPKPVANQEEPVVEQPGVGTTLPAVEANVLFTLEPFTKDKARMPANTRVNSSAVDEDRKPSAAVTLLQFYPDRDPQFHKDKSFVTGFTIDAEVAWPTTGAVSFRVLGVGGPETTINVSVDKKLVWNYQGGPEESVVSPPIVFAGRQDETKTFHLSLAVGGVLGIRPVASSHFR